MGRKKGTGNLPKENEPLAPVVCLACASIRIRLNCNHKCFDCAEYEKNNKFQDINGQEGVIKKSKKTKDPLDRIRESSDSTIAIYGLAHKNNKK